METSKEQARGKGNTSRCDMVLNKIDKAASIGLIFSGCGIAIIGGLRWDYCIEPWLGIIVGLGIYCSGLYLILWGWWQPKCKAGL